jgi:hypothetical protein
MEACYGGTDAMERSCAVARGIDINTTALPSGVSHLRLCAVALCSKQGASWT